MYEQKNLEFFFFVSTKINSLYKNFNIHFHKIVRKVFLQLKYIAIIKCHINIKIPNIR